MLELSNPVGPNTSIVMTVVTDPSDRVRVVGIAIFKACISDRKVVGGSAEPERSCFAFYM
jgi:hypothetical protein